MIEIGNFEGYMYKVYAPGNIGKNAVTGEPCLDEFECYCTTLMQAIRIQNVRESVAAKPEPPRKPEGQWNGPLTPWWYGVKREGATKLSDVTV